MNARKAAGYLRSKRFAERVEAVKVRVQRDGDILRATSGHGWWTIRKSQQGRWYCSCPAWKFQQMPAEKRWCKHLQAALEQGLIERAPEGEKEVKG